MSPTQPEARKPAVIEPKTLLTHKLGDGQSYKPAGMALKPADEDRSINIGVTQLGGEVHSLETHPFAKVSDVKAMIHEQLGCAPGFQNLTFGTMPLTDSGAVLKDVGVVDGSMLTLVKRVAMGQSCLEEANGKKASIDRTPGNINSHLTPIQALSEFEFMSWQAACEGDRADDCVWDVDPTSDEWQAACEASDGRGFDSIDTWGDIGCGGMDLYWTTATDGCRFEYWSTAPGDNEYGILVRIDADTMTAIGGGSDDGMSLFSPFDEQFEDDAAVQDILRSKWPRKFAWGDDDSEDDDDDNEDDDDDRGDDDAC